MAIHNGTECNARCDVHGHFSESQHVRTISSRVKLAEQAGGRETREIDESRIASLGKSDNIFQQSGKDETWSVYNSNNEDDVNIRRIDGTRAIHSVCETIAGHKLYF